MTAFGVTSGSAAHVPNTAASIPRRETPAQTSPWLLVVGEIGTSNGQATEDAVAAVLAAAYGEPAGDRTLHVLLDSPGGDVDSAYRTALRLRAHAATLHVHVPRTAKGAAALLALAADRIHLSAVGELGPLDTLVADPRDPTRKASALDLNRSADHGGATTADLLEVGGWRTSLETAQRYAERLLLRTDPDVGRAAGIAERMVHGYPHSGFAIDLREAREAGLPATPMDVETTDRCRRVLESYRQMAFTGFVTP